MAASPTRLNRKAVASLAHDLLHASVDLDGGLPAGHPLRAEYDALAAPCRERVDLYVEGAQEMGRIVEARLAERARREAQAAAIAAEAPGRALVPLDPDLSGHDLAAAIARAMGPPAPKPPAPAPPRPWWRHPAAEAVGAALIGAAGVAAFVVLAVVLGGGR